MTHTHSPQASPNSAVKSFRGPLGGDEHYITLTADGERDLASQIAEIEQRYCATLRDLDLAPDTAIFRRIFVSDTMNQAALVASSELAKSRPDNPVAVSLIQQPPLPGAKLALLAYHISGDSNIRKKSLSNHDLLVVKKWTATLMDDRSLRWAQFTRHFICRPDTPCFHQSNRQPRSPTQLAS